MPAVLQKDNVTEDKSHRHAIYACMWIDEEKYQKG